MRYRMSCRIFDEQKTGASGILAWCVWSHGDDGAPLVNKYARDGSGLISSLTKSDGFIELGEDVVSVAPGDLVDFIPFSSFGL